MTELVMLRAEDDLALAAFARKLVGFIDRVPGASLVDIAYTCTFSDGPCALAIVTDSVADLRARLTSAADRIAGGTVRRIRDKGGTYWFRERLLGASGGKLAFVYPSAAAFYPDMLRDLAIVHSECRGAFDELEEALAQDSAEFTPSNFIFPPAPHYRHDADVFSSGAYAQALVSTYTACVALSRLMDAVGVRPDGVAGFGGGDLAAMLRAGVAGAKPMRRDRLRLIREIYRIVDKAVAHSGLPAKTMITVLLRHEGEADAVLASLPDGAATLAIDFSPRQKTYAVDPEQEPQVMSAFASAGIRTVRLAFDRPFNTPDCEKVVPAIRKFIDGWMRDDPACELYSCAIAAPVPARLRKARAEAAERWARPAMFTDTIRRMFADGYRVFLEVGPRGLMTSAIDDTLRGEDFAAISLNSIHRCGRLQLQHAIAQLVALGGNADIYRVFMTRGARKLDFDAAFVSGFRRETEMLLSRAFPRLTFLSDETPFRNMSAMLEPKGRGARAALRAAALAAKGRRQRQFDFGASNPLVSDADEVAFSQGVSIELRKVFRLSDAPFIGDYAIGNSQLSYADPHLKGLVLLAIPVSAEIMAETAARLLPNAFLVSIDGLVRIRTLSFVDGMLSLAIRAERVPSDNPNFFAIKVQLHEMAPGVSFLNPAMEATVVLARDPGEPLPLTVDPISKPRAIHWSGRDIYPSRLCYGRRLRGITFAEFWSETGIDFEVEVPRLSDNVSHTQFPLWIVNPLLLETVISGYALWRSHERFSVWRGNERMDDAYSFPLRLRRIALHSPIPKEGAKLKCYLRLTGVTPKTHLCDITVSDGNGNLLMTISGLEESVEHVRSGYRSVIMQPATSFISGPVPPEYVDAPPGVDYSTALVTDIPYQVFERNGAVWLRTMAHIVLGGVERATFLDMPGSAARRTEWLFGRIVAKESVRRFLVDYCQAKWSYADVVLHADDMGKPYAIGKWKDDLSYRLDVAIAHTSQFVVAVTAANMRVGVDVEWVERDHSEEFVTGAFTHEELELVASAPRAYHAVIRFWCAKEAVSKALGVGIRFSPKEIVVSRYDIDANRVYVVLKGAWEKEFRRLKGREIQVSVRTMHGHALAFCFLSPALIDDEN